MENNKEILTKENIVHDVKTVFINTAKICSIVSLALVIFILGMTFLANVVGGTKMVIALLLLFTPLFLWLYIYIGAIVWAFKDYWNVKTGKFTISTDKIIDRKKKSFKRFKIGSPNPHTLIFESYGQHYIQECPQYTWSHKLSMSDTDVFNDSFLGDTFYLILNKNKKIISAYNTKYFELKQKNKLC